MSCGMTSQTSKSFSSWPAVYRWRWRNEDLMWQCVADIDRHLFRRHCGQNAAACNFGFYSCIWVQLLFIVVPAVDCGGKTCELVWACLSFMTGLDGMCIFLSYIDLRYFFMQVFNDIHGHGHCSIFFLAKPYALRHLTPFSCHEFEVVSNWFLPVMSLKICRNALNCKLTMRWWANLIKVLLILPSLLQGGRDGFSTLIFPWCRL